MTLCEVPLLVAVTVTGYVAGVLWVWLDVAGWEPPPQATVKPIKAKSRIPNHSCRRFLRSGANNSSPGTRSAVASAPKGRLPSWPEAARALTVNVAVPLALEELRATDAGDTAQDICAVAVEGTEQDKATLPLNPPVPPTINDDVPLCPTAAIENDKGVAPRLNAGLEIKPGHEVTRLKASIEPRPDVWS